MIVNTSVYSSIIITFAKQTPGHFLLSLPRIQVNNYYHYAYYVNIDVKYLVFTVQYGVGICCWNSGQYEHLPIFSCLEHGFSFSFSSILQFPKFGKQISIF